MIINSQRSIYHLNLISNMILGRPYEPLPNTTLNEKFNILTSETTGGVYPTIKYLAIGVGGTSKATDSRLKHSTHTAKDAALFEHIPFVMRTVDNDLTPDEQLKYRFRIREIVNSIEYICYYLKVIPDINMESGIFEVVVSDNIGKLGYFDTNRVDILHPTPALNTNYLDTDSTKYLAKSIKIMFELNIDDINDVNNVLNIKYDGGKVINEIGVCTGIDHTLSSGSIEAKCVELAYFTDVDFSLQSDINLDGRFIRSIEIGGSEPLIQ